MPTLNRALALKPDYPFALSRKGNALRALDRYEEAQQALDRALVLLERDYLFALGTKGWLLCDIGEFQDAVQVLNQVQFDSVWILDLKGQALQNLGVEHAEEAQQAYEVALKVDPRDLWIHKGLGDALYLRGKLEEAKTKYLGVIKQAKERNEELDADTLSLLGWCHYRLGQYDEAARLLVEALRLDPKGISHQFKLALTLLCSERYGLALREYQRGLELTESKPVQRRRGLLAVAIKDLNDVLIAQPLKAVPEFEQALELLKTALNQQSASTTLTPTSSPPPPAA